MCEIQFPCQSLMMSFLSLFHSAALAALAGSQLRTTANRTQTNTQQHEMTVPNDLIGCIIGKFSHPQNHFRVSY